MYYNTCHLDSENVSQYERAVYWYDSINTKYYKLAISNILVLGNNVLLERFIHSYKNMTFCFLNMGILEKVCAFLSSLIKLKVFLNTLHSNEIRYSYSL